METIQNVDTTPGQAVNVDTVVMQRPLVLYHCTTEKKAKAYRVSGHIKKPVRGFDSLLAALAWCVKTGRKVIYEIPCLPENTHKLPDHHNPFGCAWWIDADVTDYRCSFSAVSDA